MEIEDFCVLKPKNEIIKHEIIKQVFVKVIPAVDSGLDEEIMESVEGVDDPGTTHLVLGGMECKRAIPRDNLDMAQLGNTLKMGTELV